MELFGEATLPGADTVSFALIQFQREEFQVSDDVTEFWGCCHRDDVIDGYDVASG